MKRIYIYISIFCFFAFTACKSYTPSMSVPKNHPVAQKIGNAEIILPSASDYWKSESKKKAIIYNYIKQDLLSNYCTSHYSNSNTYEGKIYITERTYDGVYGDTDKGVAMCLFVPLFTYGTIYPLSLFGLPCSYGGIKIELDFQIFDKNGFPLKKYTYFYKEESFVGIYYGKTGKRRALDGAKNIMEQFRKDYERDFSGVFSRINNPLTKNEIAQIPPANLNIVFPETNTDYKDEKARRLRRELFYVEINEKYVGELAYGDFTKIVLPQGEYTIRLYPNSRYYNNSIEYYDDFQLAKSADNGSITITKILYANDDKSVSVSRSDKNYICQDVTLSRLQSEYLKRGNVYDIRNSNQTPLHASDSKQTNLAQQTKVKENSKKGNVPSQQTITKQPILNSHISRYAKSLVDTNIPQTKVNSDNTYVLIISNEQYDQLDNVSYAAHDGEIFKEYCQKTLGIPDKQIFFYQNATYGRIVDGVEKLKYCLNNFENSKAIVYYCGHGIPDEKTGQAYLIPVDGKGTNMTTCYSLKNLYKTLAATKAQSITYFMDACFTGANKEGSMLVAARGVAREPVKETLAGKTVVFSASSGDETAMTLEEQGHGLFTYYLLKKLQETEGNVTYGELADYINKNVKKDAFLINEKPQTPVVATSPAVQNTWKTMKLK